MGRGLAVGHFSAYTLVGRQSMKSVDTVNSVLSLKGRQFWSVLPAATVYEAIEKMSEKGVGAVLVMSEGKLAGIISERDYARKVILKDRSSKHTLVQDIMTSSLITVTPRHNVEECMRTMTENRIRHLPVVDGDQVVGVVSIGDLVNWIITAHEETIGHLQSYIAGNYPG
jgi:signal-transduction protein with cAMP-binding, CBS, and nucleotidyltransferase domain